MKLRVFLYVLLFFGYHSTSGADENSICIQGESLNLDRIYYIASQIDKRDDEFSASIAAEGFVKDVRAGQYADLFQHCILDKANKNSIAKFDSKELHRFYEMAQRIVFYTGNSSHTDIVKMITEEKIKRDGYSKSLIDNLHGIYVSTRKFHQAMALKSEYPEIEAPTLPEIVNKSFSGRSLFHIEKGGKRLVRKQFIFPRGGHIVAVRAHLYAIPPSGLFPGFYQSRHSLRYLQITQRG